MKKQEQEIDDSLLGTARIDPEEFSAVSKNTNRFESTKYALAGLIYMFRREQSTKALTFITVTLGIVLIWLEVDAIAAAIVITCTGMAWMAEILNSSIEAVVDLATDDIHPMAKVAKDVASAATLVSLLLLTIVSGLVLVPVLLEKV